MRSRRRSGQRRERARDDGDARGCLAAPVYVEFLAQVVDVVLDRRGFDSQPAADLLVREPAIDQMRDLQLAPRQRRAAGVDATDTDGVATLRQHGPVAIQRRGGPRRAWQLVAQYLLEHSDHIAALSAFWHIARRPRLRLRPIL